MAILNISMLIILILFVALIYAQVKLSAMENKYLGLIIPGISFFLSILQVIGLISYNSFGANQGISYVGLFINMMVSNIPTFVLLAIYFGVREKNRVNKQIEKMNINDL